MSHLANANRPFFDCPFGDGTWCGLVICRKGGCRLAKSADSASNPTAQVICTDPDCGETDCTGDHGLMRCPSTGQVNRNLTTVADRWTCCGGLYPNHIA